MAAIFKLRLRRAPDRPRIEPETKPNQNGNAEPKRTKWLLEHDPEKACPALDAGWRPVFGKDHAPPI